MERRELPTGSDKLRLAVDDDGVAIVTLDDPENRNPIGGDVRPALRRAIDRVAADPGVRCLLLTGAGQAFSAGGNTKAMATARQPTLGERLRSIQWESAVSAVIFEMDKPSIAALPGAAAGAGFSLALACDLRIAAQSAFMTTSFIRIGLPGDYGGTWLLTQLVGPAKARELYYTSARVPADECLRLGLVNRVVPDDQLQAEALAWARELAAAAPIALRYMKENLNRALRADLRTCIEAEAERQCRAAETEDFREAARAFVERRKPVFKGR